MNTKYLARTAAMAALTCILGMSTHFFTGGLVPFSLLPLMVFLSGIVLGPKYGALAMTIYLLLGLFGLPVFSSPPFGGIGYVFKPTFGYIIGYIPAAYVTGKVYGRGGIGRALAGALAGLAVLYGAGLSYLYGALWIMGTKAPVVQVLAIGFAPFIVSDLIKAGIAVIIGHQLVREKGSERCDSGI